MSAPPGGYRFSRVDRVLVALSRPARAPAEDAWLDLALADLAPAERGEFAAKVALNDVAPVVLRGLAARGVEPEAVAGAAPAAVWRARRDLVARRNAARAREGAALFKDLGAAGVEVILLKGGLFAETIWGDPGYKKMNDLDILIRPEAIAAARAVYAARGYLPLLLFEGGDPEAVDPTKTHHLPSFVSRDLEFVVGTHWQLCSPKKGLRLDYPRMWLESRPVDYHGAAVRALTTEDNLHHLAIHFHHYKTGLKELSDIFNLAEAEPPDWDLLAGRIAIAGSAGRAYYAFALADALRPLGAPADFLEALADGADPFRKAEVRRRLARPDLLLSSRSTYESVIEKAYARYALETRFHRKVAAFYRFFAALLFPPRAVLARTNVVPAVTAANLLPLWWKNLRRTGREIGEGFGLAVFFLVILKGIVESVLTLRHYVVPPTDDPLSRFVEATGGDEDALERLMAYLE